MCLGVVCLYLFCGGGVLVFFFVFCKLVYCKYVVCSDSFLFVGFFWFVHVIGVVGVQVISGWWVLGGCSCVKHFSLWGL